MKERGILFNGEMVRAILDGRKTVTRRAMKPQPTCTERWLGWGDEWATAKNNTEVPEVVDEWRCPYGQPGDRLWVRETWRVGAWDVNTQSIAVDYLADNYARQEWLSVPDKEMFKRLGAQSIDDAINAGLEDEEGDYHWEPGEAPTRWRPSIHMPRWASRILLEVTDVRVERVQDATEHDAIAEGFSSLDEMLRWFDDQYGSIDLWVWVVEFKRVMI